MTCIFSVPKLSLLLVLCPPHFCHDDRGNGVRFLLHSNGYRKGLRTILPRNNFHNLHNLRDCRTCCFCKSACGFSC